ncbi:Ankyrin repeat-containing protein isoform 1 [Cladophialophora immunda]|nr:Ankyrin repeat-containing protein isoform 1 [Cladophialophora immunda]
MPQDVRSDPYTSDEKSETGWTDGLPQVGKPDTQEMCLAGDNATASTNKSRPRYPNATGRTKLATGSALREECVDGTSSPSTRSYKNDVYPRSPDRPDRRPLETEIQRSSSSRGDDLHSKMQSIIPLHDDNAKYHLPDAVFDRVSEVLRQADQEEWSLRPRTFAVLWMMKATCFVKEFVELNCFDIALPYTKTNLPGSLTDNQRELFLKYQKCVLTKAVKLEGGLASTHANFADNADSHLQFLRSLGKGGSGSVDCVRSKLSRKVYARKCLERSTTFEQNDRALKFFKNEIDSLKRLKHRHLVRYVGSYTDQLLVGIIMEPVADSNLTDFLSKGSFLPGETDCIRQAFGCLCSAIVYLNLQKCRHKDIKPDNILIKQRRVYITDFGLARDWTLGKSTTTGHEIGPISRKYAAPEVLSRDPRGSSADIWSLGCVYLDMILGDSPSVNYEAFTSWVRKLESTPNNAPLEWIKKMMVIDRKKRLSPPELMSRIWNSNDDRDYFGLCCDGNEEIDMPSELRQEDFPDSASSDDLSDDGESARMIPDPAILEKRLVEAAKLQDMTTLKRWLRRATRLHRRRLNTQAIHIAARIGNQEMVDTLIQSGCSLDFLDKHGYSPLSTAVWNCCEGVTERLARTQIALDKRSIPDLRAPLHLAAMKMFHPGMRALLRAGAFVDVRNRGQVTPLHIATAKGDFLGVQLLLQHGASVSAGDRSGKTPLCLAAKHGSGRMVQLLIDHGADVNAPTTDRIPHTALNEAVFCNKSDIVRILLERGADINLQLRDKARLLPGALHIAAGNDLLEMLEILLSFHPDLELRDPGGLTPLLIATMGSNTRIVYRLLEAGADVEAKVNNDTTPLAISIARRNFDLAQTLVNFGANIGPYNGRNETPLHHAAARKDLELMKFLLKNHAGANNQDVEGITPLMLAAAKNHPASLEILLKHGASVDTQNLNRATALFAALATGCLEAASFLVSHGADPLIPSERGETPLSLAKRYGYTDIHSTMMRNLEAVGRVIYDPRWPQLPLCLSLECLKYGYEVVDIRGEAFIHILSGNPPPHARIPERTTPGSRESISPRDLGAPSREGSAMPTKNQNGIPPM